MDLQILLIIVTVFFLSLGILLFVNRQLHSGTYEEALAEKRQLTDKLYGNKKKNAKKTNTGKKVSIFTFCFDVIE